VQRARPARLVPSEGALTMDQIEVLTRRVRPPAV
jgi:hypothetical protein